MYFVNKYIQPTIDLDYAEEFQENGSSVIYSLGYSEGLPVVTKSLPDGSTVWGRALATGLEGVRFSKLIQLDPTGDMVYVVLGRVENRYILFSFLPNGTLYWSKYLNVNDPYDRADIVADITANRFFFVYNAKVKGIWRPYVKQFNSAGILGGQIQLTYGKGGNDFMLYEAVARTNGGVTLAGIVGQSNSSTILLELDSGLKLGKTWLREKMVLHDLIMDSPDKYILSGYELNQQSVILFRLDGSTTDYHVVFGTQGYTSYLSLGDGEFYASIYDSLHGRVHKLDFSLSIVWTKEIIANSIEYPLSILNSNPNTANLTFVSDNGVLLGHTNKNLDSCATVVRPIPEVGIYSHDLSNPRVSISGTSHEPLNLQSALNAHSSTIEDVCKGGGGDPGGNFELTGDESIQSGHLYLQAAGSTGADSSKGNHLRWMLRGILSEHLPKGDLASTTANFNKPDDYVRIYRTRYTPVTTAINLQQATPMVQNSDFRWLYPLGQEAVYINFLDQTRYSQVLGSVNPATDPIPFLQAYGSAPLEIEHLTELSFAVTMDFTQTGGSPEVDLELLSVEENTTTSPKVVSLRQSFAFSQVSGRKLLSENIRSVRMSATDMVMTRITFEFYSDFIVSKARGGDWQYMGQYSLTVDTGVAYTQLEPTANSVNGNWLRYNDNAHVKVQNYKDRWNSASLDPDERILNTVQKYINLSDSASNPQAIETIYFNDPNATPIPGFEPDPDFDPSENEFELSNLTVLNWAALDYHIARMLGLGVLDLDTTVFSGDWVYMAEYFTVDDLEDGLGVRDVQHLYMSLPTSLNDQRLPVPVDLKAPVPGVFFGLGTEAPAVMTDADGYSPDGRTRFLSLFNEALPEEEPDTPFWSSTYMFVSADLTAPVYAGIEYRNQGSANWDKPELPHNTLYSNIDSTVPAEQKFETRPIVIPDPEYPLFVHRERSSGWHEYSSYGINWFSRATSSTVIHALETTIEPNNTLQPPTNVNAFLVRNENPLLLTSLNEQQELAAITTTDKTFIRLTFDYHHAQELINYHREINFEQLPGYVELPDSQELFAEDIEIFFRNEVPNQVTGKVISVTAGPNDLLSVIETGEFVVDSAGINPNTNQPNQVLVPSITTDPNNFIGGVVSINGLNYVIHAVDNTGTYPKFTVFKVDGDGNSVDLNSTLALSELTPPPSGDLFMAVENMLSPASWGTPNPNSFRVNIDHTGIHKETVVLSIPDGTKETHVQKFRGILRNALIEEVLEDHDGDNLDGVDPGDTPPIHLGLYKMTFTGYSLAQHSQATSSPHRVEFWRGVVRVRTQNDPNGPRKVLNVVRTENIGTSNDLIVYAIDPTFDSSASYDPIQVGTKSVNYYPGYRTYLKYDNTYGYTEGDILPTGGDLVKYSIFGLRSRDTGLSFTSKISVPSPMYAQAIIEPQQPQLPGGGLFATRPDFYGKSTYTFTTKYNHEPYSVQFLRASDIQILSALFTDDDGGNPSVMTVQKIQEQIFGNRKDVWFNDRWKNLIGFDYTYAGNPSNNGQFEILPAAGGVQLPMPNNQRFIDAINSFIDDHNSFYGTSIANISSITSLYQVIIPGTAQYAELQVVDFVKQVVFNCFVPLTEIPIIYQHIKGSSYSPIPKKQKVRDHNGNLLSPSDPEFDMAPMAKTIGPGGGNPDHETQFTDFTIDGAANAAYFYAVREFGLQMKAGEQSPILGPISLVNAAAPRKPEVVKVTPILENRIPDIPPAIQLEINGYAEHQRIRKVNVYRATSGIEAKSIRTMTLVQSIDVVAEGIQNDTTWTVTDDFSDLGYAPYGDPLFYVVTVSREVEYHDRNGTLVNEFAPSEPSKMVLTNIVENYNPDAPKLRYYSTPVNGSGELQQVTIVWDKTVHNGKYHLFKLNDDGTWIEIKEVISNDLEVVQDLASTSLASGTLLVDDGGTPIWHQFKVVSENFAGMISREDKVLTVHNLDDWDDIVNL